MQEFMNDGIEEFTELLLSTGNFHCKEFTPLHGMGLSRVVLSGFNYSVRIGTERGRIWTDFRQAGESGEWDWYDIHLISNLIHPRKEITLDDFFQIYNYILKNHQELQCIFEDSQWKHSKSKLRKIKKERAEAIFKKTRRR